jgi:trehalose 6-phosphate phosphatase
VKPLFDKEGLQVLRQFAWSNVLLAFDFDGTLAPIVAEPGEARMRPSTAQAFCRLCELYPCVVISGRAREDVRARLGEAKVRAVVGNHGLEPSEAGRTEDRLVRAWARALAPLELRHPGLLIEDKRYSLAVHLRRVRHKQKARAEVREALRALGPVHEVPGKQVLNLLPRHVPHKGDALLRLRAALGADTALYVGDDTTDEHVFALGDAQSVLPVRVGHKASSQAWYFLERQRDIERLLVLLAREARGYRALYG